MLVYKDCIDFNVMGETVSIISDVINGSQNTVVEIAGKYFHLGDEIPNILTAILGWQEYNDRDLTVDELNQVMIVNKLTHQAI